jgi:hypothetical protein
MAGEVAPRWAGRDVSSDMMAVEGGVRSVAFLLLVISVDFAEKEAPEPIDSKQLRQGNGRLGSVGRVVS